MTLRKKIATSHPPRQISSQCSGPPSNKYDITKFKTPQQPVAYPKQTSFRVSKL